MRKARKNRYRHPRVYPRFGYPNVPPHQNVPNVQAAVLTRQALSHHGTYALEIAGQMIERRSWASCPSTRGPAVLDIMVHRMRRDAGGLSGGVGTRERSFGAQEADRSGSHVVTA